MSIPHADLGWTAGGGVEKQIAPNWTIKAEYLYFDLGSVSYANPCVTSRPDDSLICSGFAPPPSFSSDVVTRQHILRVGINYQFGALAAAQPGQAFDGPIIQTAVLRRRGLSIVACKGSAPFCSAGVHWPGLHDPPWLAHQYRCYSALRDAPFAPAQKAEK